jgi:hypothetical protein
MRSAAAELHDFANRSASEWFNTVAFAAAGQYAIGKKIRLSETDHSVAPLLGPHQRGQSWRF